ncbi:MAG: hypothetical protein IJL04_01325 [Bacteroidales bacterium]|nr:hypothetical protein [Bacteroidales bacterium]
MKVQIEIPDDAIALAILWFGLKLNDERMPVLQQAVEICKNQTTELSVEEIGKRLEIPALIACSAIGKVADRIEMEGGQQ